MRDFLPSEEIQTCFCIRVKTASGQELLIPCDFTGEEDREEGSDGTNPKDKVVIVIDGEIFTVDRADVCYDDGNPVPWKPYRDYGWEPF